MPAMQHSHLRIPETFSSPSYGQIAHTRLAPITIWSFYNSYSPPIQTSNPIITLPHHPQNPP